MRKIVAAILLALLCSCSERDANYDAMNHLAGDARLSKFESYPLAERFRLYNKIYAKSGHPHDVQLSTGFRDQPDQALTFILSDLEKSEFTDFLRYLPVFFDLGKRTSLDICRQDRIGALKAALTRYRLTNDQLAALKGLRFNGCELP